MFIYSETSKAFIERVREEIRALFFLEIENIFPVKFNRSRILYKNFQFPLNIVVFEDQTKLGYFDYRHYEIGISKILLTTSFDEVIRNVIRHEIAHYLAYLFYGPDEGHGENFKNICNRLNWNEDVYLAYANLEKANLSINKKTEENSDLLNKIKKLMSLASSDNVYESELATMKANKLLRDHNITLSNQIDDYEVYVARVITASKKNAKHMAIYEIIKTFYVSPVFNHGKSQFYLEIVGTKSNVEIASYVAEFLNLELERLWDKTKLTNQSLKGSVAKNSFMRGLAQGYVAKIASLNESTSNDNQLIKTALIKISQNNQQNLKYVYSRLGSSSVGGHKENDQAKSLGKKVGQNLSIKPGLKSNSNTALLN